jgi:uncharacterized protein (UPF0335 family)
MTRARVRYYLHNLEGLRQEIADINADLEQYRAMSSDSFLVDQDVDVLPDAPGTDGSQHQIHTEHSNVETLAVVRLNRIWTMESELFQKKTILAAINCVLYYLNGYDRQVDRQIIQLRYVEHLAWCIVAKKLYADKDNLRHRDQKIIDEIVSSYNARLK